jgi:hypothetical protein
MHDRRAKALKVKDGDTLLIEIDQGFGDSKKLSLRLLDVFAPEKDEPGGPETREFVETWLNEHDPDGDEWPFVVKFERNRSDTGEVITFNRYVGTLTAFDGFSSLGEDINAFVASRGFGHGIGFEEAA